MERPKKEYDINTLWSIWKKGKIVPGYNPDRYRKDACDAWIEWPKHGKEGVKTSFSWEVDHITPVASGGTDDLSNLRPLQWLNNRMRSDNPLTCSITSDRDSNREV
jgi:hypothetical protein